MCQLIFQRITEIIQRVQMIFGDQLRPDVAFHDLFFIKRCVGWKLHDIKPVFQDRRERLKAVGCRDENCIGQIQRKSEIVVHKPRTVAVQKVEQYILWAAVFQ